MTKGMCEDARNKLHYAEDLKALCELAVIRNTVQHQSKGCMGNVGYGSDHKECGNHSENSN